MGKTGKITVLAKKAFEFRLGQQVFPVRPYEMVEAPDWIQKDPLFGWALDAKDISVTGQEKIEEDKPLSKMKKDELIVQAQKVGATAEEIQEAKSNESLIKLIESKSNIGDE